MELLLYKSMLPKIIFASQVQNADWNSNTVSLHPTFIYFKRGNSPLVKYISGKYNDLEALAEAITVMLWLL